MLVACGRERAPAAADSAPLVAARPDTPTAAQGPCPATGRWAACSVVERLDRAGLAPRVDSSSATEPPLGPRGTLVRLGTSDLELYIYPDAAARERDQATLNRADYLEYPAPLGVRAQPTVIPSVNLIAILHSRSDHQRERVSDAITAGPPQPPPRPR